MKTGRLRITVISFLSMRRIQCARGTTVQQALIRVFKDELKGYFISVNGVKAGRDTILRDGDTLVAVIAVRGAATLKRDGKIWRYHKNDKDDIFPSDCHAHRVNNGEVLDLYTGYVYDSDTGKLLGVLPPKQMRGIYSELRRSKDRAISAKFDDDPVKFTYLRPPA